MALGIVWIQMLPEDSLEAALPSIQSMQDERIQHFIDPQQQSGRVVATSLDWDGQIAWDIYLFYGRGHAWGKLPPKPSFWMHQMSAGWAKNNHYRTGSALMRGLSDSLTKLLAH